MNGKNYESVFKNVGELIDLFLIDDFPSHPYIQTNIGIDGVTVHPGIVLNFRRNACMEEIMTCVVPADTSEDTLDNVIKAIENRLEKYEEEHGNCYGFSYSDAIYDSFKEANIRPESIPIDKTYYV